MIHNILRRELGLIKTKKILECLQQRCIKELKEDKLDIFFELLEIDVYRLEVYIDDKLVTPIENSYHDIKIVFTNNITNKTTLVERLSLVKMSTEHYNYFDQSNDINLDLDINRGTTRLTPNNIKIKPKLVLATMENTNLFSGIYTIYRALIFYFGLNTGVLILCIFLSKIINFYK